MWFSEHVTEHQPWCCLTLFYDGSRWSPVLIAANGSGSENATVGTELDLANLTLPHLSAQVTTAFLNSHFTMVQGKGGGTQTVKNRIITCLGQVGEYATVNRLHRHLHHTELISRWKVAGAFLSRNSMTVYCKTWSGVTKALISDARRIVLHFESWQVLFYGHD